MRLPRNSQHSVRYAARWRSHRHAVGHPVEDPLVLGEVPAEHLAVHRRRVEPPDGGTVIHDERSLAAYMEGELDAAEAAAWDEHLLGCETCRAAVDDAGRGRELAASLREPAPAWLRDRVAFTVGVAARSRRSSRRSSRRRVAAGVAGVAAAAVMLVAGVLFGGTDRTDKTGENAEADPVAVVFRLAADRRATPPPDGDGIAIDRLTVRGHDVVVARSDRPFSMPAEAVALANAPHAPWLARRGQVSLLCFSRPMPVLLAGRAPPGVLAQIADALGIDASA